MTSKSARKTPANYISSSRRHHYNGRLGQLKAINRSQPFVPRASFLFVPARRSPPAIALQGISSPFLNPFSIISLSLSCFVLWRVGFRALILLILPFSCDSSFACRISYPSPSIPCVIPCSRMRGLEICNGVELQMPRSTRGRIQANRLLAKPKASAVAAAAASSPLRSWWRLWIQEA